MKCPHCGLAHLGRVLETRAFEGVVYRRRYCGSCGRASVTVEDCCPDMKIPGGAYHWKKKAEPTPKAIKSDGAHLAGVWK